MDISVADIEIKQKIKNMAESVNCNFYERYQSAARIRRHSGLWTRLQYYFEHVNQKKPVNLSQWRSVLKNSGNKEAIIVWSEIKNRELARKSCLALKQFVADKKIDVVLITSIPDFSFYSRMGWMVEYVPHLYGKTYIRKKLLHLALRYKEDIIITLAGF